MEYRIQQVSKKLDVPPSTIRFWEGEFSDVIRPRRTNGRQRRYTDKDIENLSWIKDLLHQKNRSIAEARKVLLNGAPAGEAIPWEKTSVLVTGGTGAFGRHFCRFMLREHRPQVIRVFSRGEGIQNEMLHEFGDEWVRYIIGDVREVDRLKRAMEGVDIVIHGAALKQLSSCEFNPLEAVKTNIHGAQNVIEAAIDAGVKKVIALSTDKAVNPVNLYGATKLCAEKIFIHGNAYAGARGTHFSCIRFVETPEKVRRMAARLGEEERSQTVTLADPRMTCFWIRMGETADFLLKALRFMQGGEIFVPKLPSVRMADLAGALAPGCTVQASGLKTGEKLHDILITEEEGRNTIAACDMYVILPQYAGPSVSRHPTGERAPEGFAYMSQTNSRWLSPEEVQDAVLRHGPHPLKNEETEKGFR